MVEVIIAPDHQRGPTVKKDCIATILHAQSASTSTCGYLTVQKSVNISSDDVLFVAGETEGALSQHVIQ